MDMQALGAGPGSGQWREGGRPGDWWEGLLSGSVRRPGHQVRPAALCPQHHRGQQTLLTLPGSPRGTTAQRARAWALGQSPSPDPGPLQSPRTTLWASGGLPAESGALGPCSSFTRLVRGGPSLGSLRPRSPVSRAGQELGPGDVRPARWSEPAARAAWSRRVDGGGAASAASLPVGALRCPHTHFQPTFCLPRTSSGPATCC